MALAIPFIDAILENDLKASAKASKPRDDPEGEQFLFSLLHLPPSAHGIILGEGGRPGLPPLELLDVTGSLPPI
jgi:hypothetical protein